MKIKVIASSSAGNCYLVSDGKTPILLDCGIPVRRITIDTAFELCTTGACLVSHAHKDHSKTAKDLATLGIDIYTSRGTIDACELSGHRIHAVKPLEQFQVGTLQVLPFDVEHDAPEPLGFLLESMETGEKLLYATDTGFLRYRFEGVTHFMVEANFDQETLRQNVAAGTVPQEQAARLVRTHMSLETLLDMLRANDLSRVRQIYLLHLSGRNSNAEAFKRAVQEATGAEVYVAGWADH